MRRADAALMSTPGVEKRPRASALLRGTIATAPWENRKGCFVPRSCQDVIDELERIRESRLLCYVTSTRSGLDARMAPDVIPVIYRHLRGMSKDTRCSTIDLFIHSNGGEGIVPWRLVTLIREFCDTFNVLVPHLAYSAATLTALGADTVVMHPMGVLGPTDPTITTPYNPRDENNPGAAPLGIAVEDVASYFALVRDDVGIRHEDELVQALTSLTRKVHPLALGSVKRSTLQSRMLGKSLLQSRKHHDHVLSDQQIVEVVERLTSQLYYHGHPINRNEARDEIGLPFVKDATAKEEPLLWELYEAFEEYMQLETPFNVLAESLAVSAATGAPAAPNVISTPNGPLALPVTVEVDLNEMLLATVESKGRRDVFRQDLRVEVSKQQIGYQVNAFPTKSGWEQVELGGDTSPAAVGMKPDTGTRSGDGTGFSNEPEVTEPSP